MAETPSRRNFLRYAASAVVGGAVAAGGLYSVDSVARNSLSKQLDALRLDNINLENQLLGLQQQLNSSNVVGYAFGGTSGQFSTVDLSTQKLIATSTITDLSGKSLSLANSRTDSSGRVWAGEGKTGKVFAIDPSNSSLVKTIQLPGRWTIMILDLDPAGKYAYVLNLLVAPNASDADLASTKVKPSDIVPSVVYKIDTTTQQLVGSLQVARFGCDIANSPDGKFLYIPNQLDKLVTVVDLSTFTVVDSIPGDVQGEQIGGSMITSSPNGKWIFLENSPSHNWSGVDIEGQNSEIIIDSSTRKIAKEIPLDEPPGIDEFSPDGRYATITLRTKVAIVDTGTLTVVAYVPIMGPGTLTYSPDSKFAFVPSRSGNITVIDLGTFKVSNSIPMTFSPSTIVPYDLRGLRGYKLIPVS